MLLCSFLFSHSVEFTFCFVIVHSLYFELFGAFCFGWGFVLDLCLDSRNGLLWLNLDGVLGIGKDMVGFGTWRGRVKDEKDV